MIIWWNSIKGSQSVDPGASFVALGRTYVINGVSLVGTLAVDAETIRQQLEPSLAARLPARPELVATLRSSIERRGELPPRPEIKARLAAKPELRGRIIENLN